VAVRVPKDLYDAVVRRLVEGRLEHPSYAQIAAWCCEDRASEVITTLREGIGDAGRKPRGRRTANESVPLTLRFRAGELAALQRVMEQVEPRNGKVTRTAAVIAALRVAAGPSPEPEASRRYGNDSPCPSAASSLPLP
jgi:hypothetical protein